MANVIPNDLGPNPAAKKVIPDDLAGYQNIVMGLVEDGDILVHVPTRDKGWAPCGFFGTPIETLKYFDVYRRMDVPRHDAQTKPDFSNWRVDEFAESVAASPKAKTDDGNKPPLAMLPWKALRKVSAVQVYGFKKYGDYYNYKKGMEVSRQLNCAIRHIADYMDGITLDKESGESHLAHAATRILFALENIEDGTVTDDRYKKP